MSKFLVMAKDGQIKKAIDVARCVAGPEYCSIWRSSVNKYRQLHVQRRCNTRRVIELFYACDDPLMVVVFEENMLAIFYGLHSY